ncbi:hypothetical protein MFIFM68171_11226 [Madurella fahalii]|uniref:Uncharacterized protein n=1 Tax=Madurella fahalii TaxID=1157608 RepID=A0ABQ0GTF5_9PEZI
MILTGPGKWLLPKPAQSGHSHGQQDPSPSLAKHVFDEVGSGTRDDPTVAWLFDPGTLRKSRILANFNDDTKREHVEITMEVARSYGFNCVIIRKEAHDEQAWVGGHIYVVAAEEPDGRTAIRQMDNPANQRCIVLEGLEKVSEEFWFERNAWLKGDGP